MELVIQGQVLRHAFLHEAGARHGLHRLVVEADGRGVAVLRESQSLQGAKHS